MDTKRVQKLVTRFKAIHPEAKRPRNLLIIEIMREYTKIFSKIVSDININDRINIMSMIHTQLLMAIKDYNPEKKTQFNTYFYYYLLAIKRIYYGEQLKYSNIDNIEVEQTPEATDMMMDYKKVLTDEEMLLLHAYKNGKIKSLRNKILKAKMAVIKTKLYNYIAKE